MDKAYWNEIIETPEYVRPVSRGTILANKIWDDLNIPGITSMELVHTDGNITIIREKEFRGWTYHAFVAAEYIEYFNTKKSAMDWVESQI